MKVRIFDLGLEQYPKAEEFQKGIFEEIRKGNLYSALILCRHYPVITIGRQAKKENIKISELDLKQRKISLCEVSRGGDVVKSSVLKSQGRCFWEFLWE